jgi:hypothetical protein
MASIRSQYNPNLRSLSRKNVTRKIVPEKSRTDEIILNEPEQPLILNRNREELSETEKRIYDIENREYQTKIRAYNDRLTQRNKKIQSESTRKKKLPLNDTVSQSIKNRPLTSMSTSVPLSTPITTDSEQPLSPISTNIPIEQPRADMEAERERIANEELAAQEKAEREHIANEEANKLKRMEEEKMRTMTEQMKIEDERIPETDVCYYISKIQITNNELKSIISIDRIRYINSFINYIKTIPVDFNYKPEYTQCYLIEPFKNGQYQTISISVEIDKYINRLIFYNGNIDIKK